ncbi:hypothetical protein OUZ56_009457 [Daphnia magna]|uniref:Amino acid permease/ SLC12A domain-containing protein n=1 Tax=Daphnia magna TaxID=35525 RepID=A0ABR0AG18_9CRUS|nr:hypothetical protein OUZ56_009457 [Daphnia magna]
MFYCSYAAGLGVMADGVVTQTENNSYSYSYRKQIRIIGTITLIFICGLGAKYETKMKDVMFVIMVAAFTNFITGSIMGPSTEAEEARGFIGYSSNDPNKAIPKGTILAIIICSISYAGVAIICAATVTRAATGIVEDLNNGTNLNCTINECNYGLYYDYQAMALVYAFGPLNYVGCFAAAMSSALSYFVSCPALLEVITADKLYPYWMVGFWGKGYGPSKKPFRAFAFTFVLAMAFVLIAELDIIALLNSNLFLATFALMNFSTFHVSLIKPIGWRPTFKYYNTWLSLLTGILSIACMMLISLPTAMITIAIVLFFYLVVLYRSPVYGGESQ